jgi:hypothetical protein
MKTADTHTVEIKEYNNWLIIKLINTPKLKSIGIGSMLTDFNKNDLKISDEALSIIKNKLNQNKEHQQPALEILSPTKIWWASTTGILIPPNETIHIYDIPIHSYINNDINDELKIKIKNM